MNSASRQEYTQAINALADTINQETGKIADPVRFKPALRVLDMFVGGYPKDVAMGLVEAGMDGDLAADIAFDLQGWL